MLWRIPADIHVRIGTLLNSFPPSTRPDRLAGNETPLPDSDSLLSDRQSPASAAVNSRGSEAEGLLSDSKPSLSDSDLMTILRKEENAASNYQWSALSQTREDALNYYDREPYGDEQDGASQVVTSEFADVIESIMPGLMRVFTSTDDVAEFTPGAPGEEQWAKEASEYVPHVFMRQNDGFRILYWMIKDALMYRLGAVTVDLEDYTEKRRVPVQGLPQDAIDLVVAQAAEEGAELAMELEQHPAPSTQCRSRSGHRATTPAAGAFLLWYDHHHPQAQARGGRQHRARGHLVRADGARPGQGLVPGIPQAGHGVRPGRDGPRPGRGRSRFTKRICG
jgi:hypothetical protein